MSEVVFVVNVTHSYMEYDMDTGWTYGSSCWQVESKAFEDERDAEKAMLNDIAMIRRSYNDGGTLDDSNVRFRMLGNPEMFSGAVLVPYDESGGKYEWVIERLFVKGREGDRNEGGHNNQRS